VIKLLLPLLLSQWQTQGIRVNDEGVVRGYATQVNCTGTGVTCTSNGTVWTLDAAAGAGGGADALGRYLVQTATNAPVNAQIMGSLASGLVLNTTTTGVQSIYGGGTCTTPNVVQTLSAGGAPGCYQLKLDDLANPGGDKTFTMANKVLAFSYTAPVAGTGGAFEIEAVGGFSGDLLHLHQHTGNPPAGTDLAHLEFVDTDVTGLRITGPSSTSQAATITGRVDVTGVVSATAGFSGNASTATNIANNTGTTTTVLHGNAAGAPAFSGITVNDFVANQGTTTQVLHGNAAGQPSWAAIAIGELPTITVAKGGSNLITVAANQVYVGTAADTFTAKTLPSCSNATTSKLLFDNATQTFSCGTDQTSTGGGYATVQEEGAAVTQRSTLNFIGASVTCADNAGSTRTDCTFTDAGALSGLTAGGAMYATSTTAITSTGTGVSGRSTLTSGGTGAPTWVQGVRGVTMTQDRTISATTAASTTDLVWAINANEGQTFTCALTSTSTATSKIRYAVAGPASMTYMNCRVILGTTSLTTLVANMIQGQWATTCTNCTNSVTASVLTTKITDTLECSVTNGANAGNITIYFADSTAGQVNTLHKGSGCLVTGGG
jgi:hypothetical protein